MFTQSYQKQEQVHVICLLTSASEILTPWDKQSPIEGENEQDFHGNDITVIKEGEKDVSNKLFPWSERETQSVLENEPQSQPL